MGIFGNSKVVNISEQNKQASLRVPLDINMGSVLLSAIGLSQSAEICGAVHTEMNSTLSSLFDFRSLGPSG